MICHLSTSLRTLSLPTACHPSTAQEMRARKDPYLLSVTRFQPFSNINSSYVVEVGNSELQISKRRLSGVGNGPILVTVVEPHRGRSGNSRSGINWGDPLLAVPATEHRSARRRDFRSRQPKWPSSPPAHDYGSLPQSSPVPARRLRRGTASRGGSLRDSCRLCTSFCRPG